MGGDNLCDYHGVDYSYGSYGVCIVVVFFQFVNWIIKSIGPPKSLRNDEWKWRNLTISYLHAFACVIWIVTSFVVQPELFSDLQHFKSHLIVGVLTFTTGANPSPDHVKSSEVFPEEYNVFRKDRNCLGGGIFILIHKSLIAVEQPELSTDCEILWAKLKLQN
ncbi:hypothetical protein ACOMHN_033220 [Nucella lapillus]